MARKLRKKRKMLCKDCHRRNKQGKLKNDELVSVCKHCGQVINGIYKSYCEECAEIYGRCAWCGERQDTQKKSKEMRKSANPIMSS